jgi:hypothetical protein
VIGSGLVGDGLQPPSRQVINHTRRFVSPEAVLRHLLSHGVLTFDDASQHFGSSATE